MADGSCKGLIVLPANRIAYAEVTISKYKKLFKCC